MLEITKDIDLDLKEIYGISQKNKAKRYFIDIWEEKYPILKNEDVIIWLSKKIKKFRKGGKNPNKFSITTYLKPLQQYCDYNKVENPSNLTEEDVDTRTTRVMNYLDYLLKETNVENLKKLGFNKIPNRVSIINMIQSRIKSFYESRGVNIADGITSEKRGMNVRELKMDKETIKLIVPKLVSPRYRLAVKLQTQLGLRIGDVLNELTSGKYIIEQYKERYYIKGFRTTKIGIVIEFLFFTEELSNMIKSIYNTKDLTQLDLTTLLKSRSGKPMNSTDYLLRLKKAVKELGIQGNMKTHAFRKYFSSQIRKNKDLDLELREHLLAHQAVNLSEAYNNNLGDIEWFYNEWCKIESLICVDCVLQDVTDEEVIKLREKNLKLEARMDTVLKDNITIKEQLKEQEQYRVSLSNEINKLRDWIGVDDKEVKAFLKERHQKLKEEKSK